MRMAVRIDDAAHYFIFEIQSSASACAKLTFIARPKPADTDHF